MNEQKFLDQVSISPTFLLANFAQTQIICLTTSISSTFEHNLTPNSSIGGDSNICPTFGMYTIQRSIVNSNRWPDFFVRGSNLKIIF